MKIITILILTMLMTAGCASFNINDFPWWNTNPTPDPPPVVVDNDLPVNPDTGADLPNSISEQWSFGTKEYDQTWRIRFPSHFANKMGIGPGSYCMANDNRAEFRSFDADNGSKRPSYTMSLSIKLNAPVTCILYDKDGKAVGWFKCEGLSGRGRLPTSNN